MVRKKDQERLIGNGRFAAGNTNGDPGGGIQRASDVIEFDARPEIEMPLTLLRVRETIRETEIT